MFINIKNVLTSASVALLLTSGICAISGCPAPAEGEGEGGAAGEGEGEGEGEGGTAQNGDACAADTECQSGTCTPFFHGAQATGPQSFADFCTATCAQDADCATAGFDAHCLVTQLGGFCFPSCTANADCDAVVGAGLCSDALIGTNAGCLKTAGPHCTAEADCAAGENCTIFAGKADSFFCTNDTVAGLEAGASCDQTGFAAQQAGLACQVDADCPGGVAKCVQPSQADPAKVCQLPVAAKCSGFFCFEGSCSGACAQDADCPTDNKCLTFNFSNDPVAPELVGLCSPQKGSGAVCNKDADCSNGEHCGLTQDAQGNLTTVCRAADAGDVQLGERCGDDFLTTGAIEPVAGCVTNLCTNDNTCTAVCNSDGDCGTGTCLKVAVNQGADSLGICVSGSTCATDADCTAGSEVCGPASNFDGTTTSLVKICSPHLPNALEGGATCDPTIADGAVFDGITCFNDLSCSTAHPGSTCNLNTRTCLPPLNELCTNGCHLVDHRCDAVCTADADCTAAFGADGRCIGLNFVLDDKGTADDTTDDQVVAVGHCFAVAGSKDACTKTADCTTVGEVCHPGADLQGNVVGICGVPDVGGVAVGQTCGVINKALVDCAEGLCDDDNAADNKLHGTCRASCGVDGDCSGGQTCQTVVDALGVQQNVKVCK